MLRIVTTVILGIVFVAGVVGCSKSTQPNTEGAKPMPEGRLPTAGSG